MYIHCTILLIRKYSATICPSNQFALAKTINHSFAYAVHIHNYTNYNYSLFNEHVAESEDKTITHQRPCALPQLG